MDNKIDGKNLIALFLFNDWLIPQSLETDENKEDTLKEIKETI